MMTGNVLIVIGVKIMRSACRCGQGCVRDYRECVGVLWVFTKNEMISDGVERKQRVIHVSATKFSPALLHSAHDKNNKRER